MILCYENKTLFVILYVHIYLYSRIVLQTLVWMWMYLCDVHHSLRSCTLWSEIDALKTEWTNPYEVFFILFISWNHRTKMKFFVVPNGMSLKDEKDRRIKYSLFFFILFLHFSFSFSIWLTTHDFYLNIFSLSVFFFFIKV